MPGILPKQVRFAYQNLFHSPPTPALSFSVSTISSDSGPVTPPFPTHTLPVPYSAAAAPVKPIRRHTYTEPIKCHPLLRTAAPMTWDMMDHPSAARHNYKAISRRVLSEPATFPSISILTISSPHLPWTTKVYASNGSFVSLEDVLSAIYHSLRKNITSQEFNSLPTSDDRRRATRAYEQRYRRQRSSRDYETEKQGGMKRIDFLMGHTRFLGISNHSRRAGEWSLNVS